VETLVLAVGSFFLAEVLVMTRSLRSLPKPGLLVLSLAAAALVACSWSIAQEAAAPADPTSVPSVTWLSKSYPVPDADAKDEASMKKYTEQIPGTELKFDMVPIKGGTFLMGSPDSEQGRNKDEGPQVERKIEPFWMAACEVPWELYDTWSFKLDIQRRNLKQEKGTEWDSIADAIARPTNPYTDMTFGMGHDGYPAICMTQYAAQMFCKWLTAKTGRYYRLPTEAEWEYACRAGTKTAYSFGDDPKNLGDYGWYFDNAEDAYHKIGLKKPNPWGLFDMHGNVAEWVLDQYIPDYYAKLKAGQAKGPFAVPTTEYPRVVRGGSWDDDPEGLRSAARRGSSPDWKMQDPQIPQSIWYLTDGTFVGFRVVRPLRVPTAEEAKLYEPDPQIMREYKEAQGGKE
jgi:formylglycine-generating enzyme required for sulfatase activity